MSVLLSSRHPVTTSPAHPVTGSPGSIRIWIITASAGLSVLAVLSIGVVAREAVHDRDRFTVSFAEINCTPPPGQERHDFLAEVQYLAGMPDRSSILEEGLASRIADAFARHPCVEEVDRVALLPDRPVSVRLRFRVSPREPSVATAR
jgi:hypothetical protein